MKRSFGGSLLLISLFLAASGVIRFGFSGMAVALEVGASEPDPVVQSCQTDLGIERLMQDLDDREERILAQEAAVEEKLVALSAAEELFERHTTALINAEQALSATMTQARTAASDDVAQLIAVYENMKPQEAAALFEEMAPEFAAGFIGEMRPEAAAPVMAGLTPETAYTVSVILAGRNALAPSE